MEDEYDVAIIGSGLGGLETAYILSKEGYKVIVLEKNQQLGGNLQCFKFDGVRFDTGVHYVGGLDKGQNLNRFFRYFGILDKLHLKRMDEEGYDVISFRDNPTEYQHCMSHDRFSEQLLRYFPKEKEAISKYMSLMKSTTSSFPLYNIDNIQTDYDSSKVLELGLKETIDAISDNKLLKKVLLGSNLLYEGNSQSTPFYVHALSVNSLIESSWRFVDGADQITRLLARQIRQMGGKIMRYANVQDLIIEDQQVKKAVLSNGREIIAKHFVSNVHPVVTMDMMRGGKFRKIYENRIRNLENSTSGFSLHIVFKEKSFPFINKNHYHYTTENIWDSGKYIESEWPRNIFVCTPVSSKSDRWAEGMSALALMRFEEVSKWADSYSVAGYEEERGQEYLDWKEKKSEKIIEVLEDKFPGIRSCIASCNSSSPLTYRDYLGSHQGSLYGINKDYKNHIGSTVTAKTKFQNLFWTGQNVNLHGVLGVTVSSIYTAAHFVGLNYLIDKVKLAST